MERQKQAAGQCLQSDSFQMDLFARSVTSSGLQSVHRSISFANKSLPAKTLTIASKQRVSQTWCDSGTKWVPSCANPLTRQDLEQSCKHCFGNVPLERCVMGCSKSARQLRWCNWVKTSPVDWNIIHSKLETQYSKANLREIKYDIPAMKIILNPIIVQ